MSQPHSLLTVAEAQALVFARCHPLGPVRRPIRGPRGVSALGTILAEEIAADRDSPPFDKSLVDGYAVRSADLATGPTDLLVLEEITAGRWPSRALEAGQASAIMTGAPLPVGADAVVMVETTEPRGDRVILRKAPDAGANVLPRGREFRAGEVLLRRGDRLRPVELGLLASVGRHQVSCVEEPSIRLLPTGDELVDCRRDPGPGQIRDSNSVLLASLLLANGFDQSSASDIVPDDMDSLTGAIRDAFEPSPGSGRCPADALILTGGVSAGKLDLVPRALAESGVAMIFHKVAVRPGKPIWFGVGPERPGRAGCLVFGLPGNPVSSLIGLLLFVLPALRALGGGPASTPSTIRLPLVKTHRHAGERATYHPSRLVGGAVEPLPWAGSPDLHALTKATGFANFPAGDREYREGELVEFLPLTPMLPTVGP